MHAVKQKEDKKFTYFSLKNEINGQQIITCQLRWFSKLLHRSIFFVKMCVPLCIFQNFDTNTCIDKKTQQQ